MNGGGLFVLIYLLCVIFIGLPIMISEFAIGRSTQRSPVEAFRMLSSKKSPWQLVGWMGVFAGFIILSYYSVVAGWTMHYVVLALKGFNGATDPDKVAGFFGALYGSTSLNLFWHEVFMALTVGIVLCGVKGGIEKASKFLMPLLFIMLLLLFVKAATMPGFAKGFKFIFLPDSSKLTGGSVLEAMGQAFFSLSLGMGAMLTYGSYLSRDADIPKSAGLVALMDTAVGIMAALIMFPIIFSFSMDPQQGPGLVFKSLPIVFTQMPGGMFFAVVFFLLLVFAALTSAISLMEVVASFFIDSLGWDRTRATLLPGLLIFAFGVPSALAGGDSSGLTLMPGLNVFDSMDYLASNWLLPLGGLFIAVFVGWRMDIKIVEKEFKGSVFGFLLTPWLLCVRFLCPLAVAAVFVYGIVK